MAEELKQATDFDEPAKPLETDCETWDWARAAGVSREDLLKAVELSRRA